MKVQLLAIFVLVTFIKVSSASHLDQEIKEWLKHGAEELGETNNLLKHIDSVNGQIKKNLEEQKKALVAIALVEELLAKQNVFLDAQSEVLLEAFHKISVKGEASAEKIGKDLGGLARLQEGTKQLIISLGQKLDGFQRHVLNSARGIDQSVDQLAKLVARAILPQLNGLQCSFDSLETSQINIEVELKNLGRIKDVSENTNVKLSILDRQLKDLNRTQTDRLDKLTGAVKHLKPLSTWEIEGALKELIISQKRIELDLEACGKRPHHHAEPDYHPQSYDVKDLHSHSLTEPHPKPPAFPESPKHTYEESNQHQPHHQTYKKPVDLVQVWSIAEPQKHGEVRRVSAYAESPEPKPKSNKQPPVYNTHEKNPVSWQEPLPWEAESHYQSGPASTTNHKPDHYHSEHQPQPWNLEPVYGSHPALPERRKQQPQHWESSPQKQYKPEPHHHAEPHLPYPKQTAPVHPGPRHSSPIQEQSYNQHQPHPQPYKKPVDLVQVWSIAEPQKQGEVHRVSAYAESPEPKPKSNKPPPVYNAHEKNPVSWKEPLPWEAESLYHSGLQPSPNHKPDHYRSLPEKSKQQHQHWNTAPKQYNSESHYHVEPHLPESKQSAPAHPEPRHSSPPQKSCNQKKHQNEPQHPAPGIYGHSAYSRKDSKQSHHIPHEIESWRTWLGANQKSGAY